MTTDDREKLKLQLMRHEGIKIAQGRAVPYLDTVGKVTIGFGRNLTDRGMSLDEAHFLLENDVDLAIRDAMTFPWFADLDAIRQRVIVDMCFNLGLPKLRQFTHTLAMVARGDYDAAADAMLSSKWAGQVKTRATRLAQMMRTGKEAA